MPTMPSLSHNHKPAAANAGRDEKPAEGAATSGQLAEDEPMPEWERDLLQPAGAPAEAGAESGGEAAAEAPSTPSA